MPEEIQKFDPSTLADRLKDRIRNSIADLIPDEQWNEMMKRELHRFFNDTTTTSRGGYYNETKAIPSTFAQVFNEVMVDTTRKQLVEYLNRPEYQPVWNAMGNGTNVPGDAIRKLIAENAPALVEALFAKTFQDIMSSIRNAMQNVQFR